MVALRTDVDELGRSTEDRRLIMLWNIARGYALRLATFGKLASHPEVARIAGESWMRALAARADILARRAEVREHDACSACLENDQACALHSVPCECRRPWGCSDRCVCFGVGVRGSFFANVECQCWDFEDELADEDALDEAEERRAS